MLQHVPNWTHERNFSRLSTSSYTANTEMPFLWADPVRHKGHAGLWTVFLQWGGKEKSKTPSEWILGKTFSLSWYSPSRGNLSFCWHLLYVSRCGTAQTNMHESDKCNQLDFSCVMLQNEFITNRHALRGCGGAEVSPSLQTKIKNETTKLFQTALWLIFGFNVFSSWLGGRKNI